MIDLHNGDCLEVMDKLIEDGVKVDAIICDPPYGTTACKWDSVIPFDLMWERLNKLIKPNGAIVLFGSEPFSSALRMSNINNYKYDWVWIKNRPSNPNIAKYRPLNYVEYIHIFGNNIKYYPIRYKGKKNNNNSGLSISKTTEYSREGSGNISYLKYPKNYLIFDKVPTTFIKHPTQKPVELMEYFIKTYTNENETVLDFTMGSGSTGVACKHTNRKFIGIEKDETYFNIAKERIEKEEEKIIEEQINSALF